VAAAKERAFTAYLREHTAEPWPGTVRLLTALRRERVPCAAISSSRHAPELLAGAGVLDLLDTVVDGNEVARLRLAGKPSPDIFLEAAHRLGGSPAVTLAVEDALAGVEAGRRGRFGLVVGVDRAGTSTSAADLLQRGADVVVRDLSELLISKEGMAHA
jgi:HAD superfamily hydrolase (TIGR01509 family)